MLLLAISSIALKKDSRVESSNRKDLGKRLQHTVGRVTFKKIIKNIKLKILFYTGKYLGGGA